MNLFKFTCPKCNQHIEAERDWVGRQINCPACGTSMPIPQPAATKDEGVASAEARMPGKKADPGRPDSAAPPEKPEPIVKSKEAEISAPETKPPDATATTPLTSLAATALEPVPGLRTAILTAEIKLEIVRAVRQRIAQESTWLPGTVGGKNAYAAMESAGQTVLVDVTSPEATRFSLIGAFLNELHNRRVTATAPGRRKLLDVEIVNAAQDVLLQEMTEEEREQTDESLGASNLMTLSQAQCLAALDLLEERYSERAEQVRAEKIRRKLTNVRLPDLVKKLEARSPINSEDVATALFHELAEIRRRLERLESQVDRKK